MFPKINCARTFKASSEEVVVMCSEKMKVKYMKRRVLKIFSRKLAGCHLATSLRVNFLTDNFQQF